MLTKKLASEILQIKPDGQKKGAKPWDSKTRMCKAQEEMGGRTPQDHEDWSIKHCPKAESTSTLIQGMGGCVGCGLGVKSMLYTQKVQGQSMVSPVKGPQVTSAGKDLSLADNCCQSVGPIPSQVRRSILRTHTFLSEQSEDPAKETEYLDSTTPENAQVKYYFLPLLTTVFSSQQLVGARVGPWPRLQSSGTLWGGFHLEVLLWFCVYTRKKKGEQPHDSIP